MIFVNNCNIFIISEVSKEKGHKIFLLREKGIEENSAWHTSYPAWWSFCLLYLITFIAFSSTNKDCSLSFCGFKDLGIWWLGRRPSFQSLTSWAVNSLRLVQKSTKSDCFFEVINVVLPQGAPDEKRVCIFASLCLFLCLCLHVEQDFSLFPWCIASLPDVSNWFFCFRGLELCQSSRVCLKLFIDLSFLLPLLSLWAFYNCHIFCI